MEYDFDKIIDRKNTDSCKYDLLREAGFSDNALSMWVADMDFETAPEIRERLVSVAGRGIYGYMIQPDVYYKAVQNWFDSRFQWKMEKDWILCTPGVVFALAAAVRAYTKPGDNVLIQRPVYYPFSSVIEQNGRNIINSPLVLQDGIYEMNFADMEQKITDNHVKMMILCSPHNPISRVWTKEELERAADICLRHHVIMIVDEIHCDFVWEGYHHTSFGTLDEKYAENAVICTAPSKTFNLAGLQTSNIIIRNPELREQFQRELTGMSYFGPGTFGQLACQTAYEQGGAWVDALLSYIQGNIGYVRDFSEKNFRRIRLIEPQGTYLLWLDFRACGLAMDELKEKMKKEAEIWLDAGDMFGDEGIGFMRINVACPRSIVIEAMNRIKKVFE